MWWIFVLGTIFGGLVIPLIVRRVHASMDLRERKRLELIREHRRAGEMPGVYYFTAPMEGLKKTDPHADDDVPMTLEELEKKGKANCHM